MRPRRGYVKLYRSTAEHWSWHRGPFSMGQFWVHLLLSANYHESTVRRGLRTLTVKRGQLLTSVEKLSPTLLRDRKTVRAWLRAFASDGMLDIETDHGGDGGYTLLTIRNYEKFQGVDPTGPDDALDGALPDEMDDGLPFRLDNGLDDGLPTSKKLKKLKQRKNREENNLKNGGAAAPASAPQAWITLLNNEAGRDFRAIDADMKHVRERIREGFTLDQAEAVVRFKVRQWTGTDQAQYLQPSTLFGPKFQGYLQAARNGHADARHVNAAWAAEPKAEAGL